MSFSQCARFAILTLAAFLFLAPSAKAIESGGLIFFPTFDSSENEYSSGWFLYEAKPGETVIDFVTLGNTGDDTLSLTVYPVDALTTDDGAFALANKSSKQTDVGSWVRLAKSSIQTPNHSSNERRLLALGDEESASVLERQELLKQTFDWTSNGESLEVVIPPRGRTIIPLLTSVPHGTEIGDHAGGIVAQDQQQSKMGAVSVVKRVGVRMYITIPGQKLEKFAVDEMIQDEDSLALIAQAKITNLGNVRLEPEFFLKRKNIITGEEETFESAVSGATVFPGKTIMLSDKWPKSGFGIYQYEVGVKARSFRFMSVPNPLRSSANKNDQTPGASHLLYHGYYVSVNFAIIAGLVLLTMVFWIAVLFMPRMKPAKLHRRRH
ncbi:MAG: hypothetical protein AAB588_05730 [Patescibacteria group bacterium]